ncbi:hypothetical protein [Beijerinckia sp. L45]|uniref:hypothetical protein n=1 Tax=Beijerinckia sp. L45 TaxID=1641855 RepID=UPI00131CDF46|nr:hypothetical protein [Beijerinckia sp. L45]
MIGRRLGIATVGCLMLSAHAHAQGAADAPAPKRSQSSTVYQLLGAGLALRYEAAACGVVATPAQTAAIAQKLEALIKKSKSSAAEVAAYKARTQAKIDPLIAANANFCTTIAQSFSSYVDSFVTERPTAEWEDAAQVASGGSSALVGGWTVDTRDCTITYAYGDEGHPTGIFLGKVQGAIAVTLQHDGWAWNENSVVLVTTHLDQTAIKPLVAWHAAKTGPYLAAVFPAASLPDFARAGAIALAFDGKEAAPATFLIPGIADALVALDGCGGP